MMQLQDNFVDKTDFKVGKKSYQPHEFFIFPNY